MFVSNETNIPNQKFYDFTNQKNKIDLKNVFCSIGFIYDISFSDCKCNQYNPINLL